MTESKDLLTKGDKARAAAEMGQTLKNFGIAHEIAAQAAHHELQHALADNGPGKIGIDIDTEKRQAKPYYSTIGERTVEEDLKIAQAATDGLSRSDKKRIEELKNKTG